MSLVFIFHEFPPLASLGWLWLRLYLRLNLRLRIWLRLISWRASSTRCLRTHFAIRGRRASRSETWRASRRSR